MLTAAVRSGAAHRVRNGWYSTLDPSDPRFRAVRVGGRLTGLSAFEVWGGWVWRRPPLVQVCVPANAARLRAVAGVELHYDDAPGGTASEVSVVSAMTRVLLDEEPEVAIPCVDWALRTGRADRIDVERAFLSLPLPRREVSRLVDWRSQSVLESVARVRLRQAGFRVRSQQKTGDLGGSDLTIEGSVVLETDGRKFHEKSFESDRRRDLVTTIEGRHVIRASYSMVRDEWPAILAAIRAALASRYVGSSGDFVRVGPSRQRSHRRQGQVS